MNKTKLENIYKNLDLGKNFKESKRSLCDFRTKIDELKLLQSDPCNFIYEHFSNLRNEIEIQQEEANKNFLEIIVELNKLEADCKGITKSQSDISLVEFENTFCSLKEDLDKLKIDIDL